MTGSRLGPLIVASGGLLFTFLNSGRLPDPLPWVVPAVGCALFALTVWHSVVRERVGRGSRPAADAFRTYWISVTLMLVAFLVGTQVILRMFDAAYLVPAWIGFVVGAHFLPFARAFGAAVFVPLGVLTMVETALGGTLAVLVDERFADAAAATVGVTMLACMLAGPDLGAARLSLPGES